MNRLSLAQAGNATGMDSRLWDSPFLRACRGERVWPPPVWLMRQAGRYMASYRVIRARHSFLELCRDAAVAAEVTIDAQVRLGVDAAIVFSDILLILAGFGLDLSFDEGHGPRFSDPVRCPADLGRLADADTAAGNTACVAAAVAACRAGLAPDIPLIGFAGAPFTLAAYACEGGGSKRFLHTRRLMHHHPRAWDDLAGRLGRAVGLSLAAQVRAGAQAVQLFDSWGGTLTRDDYERFALPALRTAIALVPAGVPVIVFASQAAHLSDLLASTGAEVVGVDQYQDLSAAAHAAHGHGQAVQGNLDPWLLLAPQDHLLRATGAMLDRMRSHPGGWICNLGHGIAKETDEAAVRAFVERVHRG